VLNLYARGELNDLKERQLNDYSQILAAILQTVGYSSQLLNHAHTFVKTPQITVRLRFWKGHIT